MKQSFQTDQPHSSSKVGARREDSGPLFLESSRSTGSQVSISKHQAERLRHIFNCLRPDVDWTKEEFMQKLVFEGTRMKITTRNKNEIQVIKQAITDLQNMKKEDLVIEEEVSGISADPSVFKAQNQFKQQIDETDELLSCANNVIEFVLLRVRHYPSFEGKLSIWDKIESHDDYQTIRGACLFSQPDNYEELFKILVQAYFSSTCMQVFPKIDSFYAGTRTFRYKLAKMFKFTEMQTEVLEEVRIACMRCGVRVNLKDREKLLDLFDPLAWLMLEGACKKLQEDSQGKFRVILKSMDHSDNKPSTLA